MKRRIALWMVLMLIFSSALAETARGLIPEASLWGMSRTNVNKQFGGTAEAVMIGENAGLKVAGIEVEGYVMDAYYVFSENMRTYYGLSKVSYLLTGTQKRPSAVLDEAYGTLTDAFRSAIGAPDSVKDAVTTWKKDRYKVEIGKGKFKNYDGSDNTNVAIVFTGLNIPKPTREPTPTPVATPRPASTPKAVADEKEVKVRVITDCDDYNSSGSDWKEVYTVNDKTVKNDDILTVRLGEKLRVEAVITDRDNTENKGSYKATYEVTESKMKKRWFNIKLNFDVEAKEGKYKGKYAKWTVTFRFEDADTEE